MSAMKAWMMDMEDMVVTAIENGASNVDEVISYVTAEYVFVDKTYIKRLYTEQLGLFGFEDTGIANHEDMQEES